MPRTFAHSQQRGLLCVAPQQEQFFSEFDKVHDMVIGLLINRYECGVWS